MNHVVVMAVSKRLQDLPHVVAVWTGSRRRRQRTVVRAEGVFEDVLPGHRFAVDKPGVGPLDDFETKVCSVHAGGRERKKEESRDQRRDDTINYRRQFAQVATLVTSERGETTSTWEQFSLHVLEQTVFSILPVSIRCNPGRHDGKELRNKARTLKTNCSGGRTLPLLPLLRNLLQKCRLCYFCPGL